MRGIKPACESCPDRIPDLRPNNASSMSMYLKASNCLRYISGMEGVYIGGIYWGKLKKKTEIKKN